MPDTRETEFGLWPTPNAMEGGQTSRGGERRGELLLGGMVKLWPTPRAEERSQHNSADTGMALSRKVKLLPSPDADCWKGGKENQRRGQLNGSLNPDWVEWLMGYPTGWTASEASEPRSSSKSANNSSNG